jgi:hypothetical protein
MVDRCTIPRSHKFRNDLYGEKLVPGIASSEQKYFNNILFPLLKRFKRAQRILHALQC